MSSYRIRFEGPSSLALDVVTALADAAGVELTSSQRPSPRDEGTVVLDVTVDGALRDLAAAVDHLRSGLPAGASIQIDVDD